MSVKLHVGDKEVAQALQNILPIQVEYSDPKFLKHQIFIRDLAVHLPIGSLLISEGVSEDVFYSEQFKRKITSLLPQECRHFLKDRDCGRGIFKEVTSSLLKTAQQKKIRHIQRKTLLEGGNVVFAGNLVLVGVMSVVYSLAKFDLEGVCKDLEASEEQTASLEGIRLARNAKLYSEENFNERNFDEDKYFKQLTEEEIKQFSESGKIWDKKWEWVVRQIALALQNPNVVVIPQTRAHIDTEVSYIGDVVCVHDDEAALSLISSPRLLEFMTMQAKKCPSRAKKTVEAIRAKGRKAELIVGVLEERVDINHQFTPLVNFMNGVTINGQRICFSFSSTTNGKYFLDGAATIFETLQKEFEKRVASLAPQLKHQFISDKSDYFHDLGGGFRCLSLEVVIDLWAKLLSEPRCFKFVKSYLTTKDLASLAACSTQFSGLGYK